MCTKLCEIDTIIKRRDQCGHASFQFVPAGRFRVLPCSSDAYSGPKPKQLVVVMAVRKAVRAATITFTATSTIFPFFIMVTNL